jgi:hypothetical protein
MQVPEIKKYGGGGGIRTLDTGISQYSGLANLSFFGAAQLSQRLTRGRDVPKLGEDALISAIFVLHFVLHTWKS